jgi:cytochrome bd-type quinol oxidase subunit 2
MSAGFVWWMSGMILAALYVVFCYRVFRGKVRLEEGRDHGTEVRGA